MYWITYGLNDKAFLQIINHGINTTVINAALEAASGFFDLPKEKKAEFASEDISKPVRYGESPRDGISKARDILKLYAHPLGDWIHLWPLTPKGYRYANSFQHLITVGISHSWSCSIKASINRLLVLWSIHMFSIGRRVLILSKELKYLTKMVYKMLIRWMIALDNCFLSCFFCTIPWIYIILLYDSIL